MAILSSFGAEEREKYIGWIEAAFGLGMLFGPLLGAVMYNYGGYQCPFITFTVIYFYPTPIFHGLLSKPTVKENSPRNKIMEPP